MLNFRRDTINLDQFASPTRTTLRATNERFLGELLWPPETKDLTPRIRNGWLAEAHNRMSQPLYCLAFAMIAMAAVMRGRRQRGAVAMRLTLASLAAAAVRIAGYGVAGAAQNQPALLAAFYLIPLGLGAGPGAGWC